MSGDREISAEKERDDTDRKHGEHILAITGADKSRDETTRSLLDAISQARLAQEDKQA